MRHHQVRFRDAYRQAQVDRIKKRIRKHTGRFRPSPTGYYQLEALGHGEMQLMSEMGWEIVAQDPSWGGQAVRRYMMRIHKSLLDSEV